jgi:ATP-dependent DNA helicase RecQ
MGPSGAVAAAPEVTGMFQQLARRVNASLGNGPTLPPVPVLLVDDMVDSGWTLTLAAVLLQHHGSRPVYPFALAKASPRGG